MRTIILNIILTLEKIESLFQELYPTESKIKYQQPTKTSQPSFYTQVINPEPLSFITDPVLYSLKKNYYYPLTSKMALEEMEDNNEDTPTTNHNSSGGAKPTTQVETSIDTISDILQEMEGDEPPTQSEFITANTMVQKKPPRKGFLFQASFFHLSQSLHLRRPNIQHPAQFIQII
jgi:hypothetical protein